MANAQTYLVHWSMYLSFTGLTASVQGAKCFKVGKYRCRQMKMPYLYAVPALPGVPHTFMPRALNYHHTLVSNGEGRYYES